MALWDMPTAVRTVESSISLPVAKVLPDKSQPHLDHAFDYEIPPRLDEQAQPGRRVRIRMAGTLTTAWLLERSAVTSHSGSLRPIERVVDAITPVTTEFLAFARELAHDHGGVTTDVLSQAIPPRHARIEEEWLADPHAHELFACEPDEGGWRRYAGGAAFIRRLADGESPAAAWQALPGWGDDSVWTLLALAARACVASRRRALLVVPTRRDLTHLESALHARCPGAQIVVIHSGLSIAERYRAFLAATTGSADIVVGTRAAALCPLPNLGLIAVWDEASTALAFPRAPYMHTRSVAKARALGEGCALVYGTASPGVWLAHAIEEGWLKLVAAGRSEVRRSTPRIHLFDRSMRERAGSAGRGILPARAIAALREGLATGPVFVEAPRPGYATTLTCSRCRVPARCSSCGGRLAADHRGRLSCRWCGQAVPRWRCPNCLGTHLAHSTVGARRIAEDLGRSFAGVPIVSSQGGDRALPQISHERPVLVVATPGALPECEDGYAAGCLLDAHAFLDSASIDVPGKALRRWLSTASLLRAGSPLFVVGELPHDLAQALVRWDPLGYARTDLTERSSLGLPPVFSAAVVEGACGAVTDTLRRLSDSVRVLGPVPDGENRLRAIVQAREGPVGPMLHAVAAQRAARRLPPVRIRVNPDDL